MKVYVVWEPVLGGDADRATDATNTISGPNVTHYWDPGATTGEWAEDNLPWDQLVGPAWDVFYLFDQDATWTDLSGTGRPEHMTRSQLATAPRTRDSTTNSTGSLTMMRPLEVIAATSPLSSAAASRNDSGS